MTAVEETVGERGDFIAAKADAGKGFAVGKSEFAHICQCFGQFHLHQRVTAQERAVSDGLYAVLHIDQ